MSQMTKNCPKCGEKDQEGEDLGDHPAWLEFECEACGHAWGEDVSEESADAAQAMWEDQQDNPRVHGKEKQA